MVCFSGAAELCVEIDHRASEWNSVVKLVAQRRDERDSLTTEQQSTGAPEWSAVGAAVALSANSRNFSSSFFQQNLIDQRLVRDAALFRFALEPGQDLRVETE